MDLKRPTDLGIYFPNPRYFVSLGRCIRRPSLSVYFQNTPCLCRYTGHISGAIRAAPADT